MARERTNKDFRTVLDSLDITTRFSIKFSTKTNKKLLIKCAVTTLRTWPFQNLQSSNHKPCSTATVLLRSRLQLWPYVLAGMKNISKYIFTVKNELRMSVDKKFLFYKNVTCYVYLKFKIHIRCVPVSF